ncbi:penicillin-binding protein 6, Serine peptidase, MEROPS family S11 [Candidatus Ruthia magnifica str. Cm (Calyptogena magnifica)]|uniref:serine-type D-Ala-D-Ala carboxypeptidase n=1 Tax=Ruthia magnifica subsp. Calyptogena magnifica TaxID=413404 RepID=A1AWB9_RUTMC|nr:D-alanyl-D-alanine carboxypeptidase family protein [Candidatus Ruthturnera calyptogenae]ABL02226.1 penicillin-binding protein 6, Serine peptidase, MEROPS family S11 [Candidatus Ruthia magnifica str. Cm (Calyptogena magnifica)]
MQYQLIIKPLVILISSLVLNTQAVIFITPKAPKISTAAYSIVDYNSGKVIASSKQHDKRAPASLTKLMTAYVVFQFINDGRISLEDEVRISKKAWKTGGSKSFVEVGKSIKLETLLKGMIIQSGNDSAVALAEHIAGTESTFTTYMNEYARQLGMNNSWFENASGLPNDNQYTTAADITLLAIATIRDFPKFYQWYSQKEFTYHGIKQRNRNKLLWSDHTVDGLKTGFTKKAGYNLVASAKRAGMRLISVVLGSSSVNARTSQTQKILDYGFRFFETQTIKDIKKEVPIASATKDTLKVGTSKVGSFTLVRGQFKLSDQVIQLDTALSAPIKKGDIVGKLLIQFRGKTIVSIPLIALENIQQASFFSRMLGAIGF